MILSSFSLTDACILEKTKSTLRRNRKIDETRNRDRDREGKVEDERKAK